MNPNFDGLDDLDLMNRTTRGGRLSGIIARGATIQLATFDDAFLTHVDLSEANLERTSWRGVTAEHCAFDDAVLVDARFDHAVFTDCSFNGARFGVAAWPVAATMTGARFVRCDLRGTSWEGRDLSGVELVECKLRGVHGRPLLPAAAIIRPDLRA